MKGKMVCTLALAAFTLAVASISARAQSPFALRLGMYGSSSYQSRAVADNKGAIVGAQYTLTGIPAVLNGEAWSTVVSVDYYIQLSDNVRFQAIPVSLSQIYTFPEQSGKTPYAGFCLTAVTYKSDMVTPKQVWVTRFGGGLVLGLNISDKMFIEGRYETFDKHGAQGTPEGFRAVLGYRF